MFMFQNSLKNYINQLYNASRNVLLLLDNPTSEIVESLRRLDSPSLLFLLRYINTFLDLAPSLAKLAFEKYLYRTGFLDVGLFGIGWGLKSMEENKNSYVYAIFKAKQGIDVMMKKPIEEYLQNLQDLVLSKKDLEKYLKRQLNRITPETPWTLLEVKYILKEDIWKILIVTRHPYPYYSISIIEAELKIGEKELQIKIDSENPLGEKSIQSTLEYLLRTLYLAAVLANTSYKKGTYLDYLFHLISKNF